MQSGACADQWGGLKPTVQWLCPLEVLRATLKNPKLKAPGKFAYSPEFFDGKEHATIQLHQSAWWHVAQHSIGMENMVLAVVTNCDGTNTSAKGETIFFYMRLGNATAPGCFDRSMTRLIGIIPDVRKPDGKWKDDDSFQRARLRLVHDSVAKIFDEFNKASMT